MRLAFTALVLASAGVAACNLPDSELTILGFPAFSAPPDCKLADPSIDSLKQASYVLDVGGTFSLSIGLTARNDLSGLAQDIDNTQRDVFVTPANQVQPLRFFARWECDQGGFSNGEGPLTLPTFDPVNPFCLNNRTAALDTFPGQDILPVTGPPIQPGGGIANMFLTAVPFELGRGFWFLFEIAINANECCIHSNNCDGRDVPPSTACAKTQTLFDTIDKTLKVTADMAGTPSRLLAQYQRFAVYDGNYASFGLNPPLPVTAYSLVLHGVLEGVDGTGSLVHSNDTAIEIKVCRNCGPRAASAASCTGGTSMGPKTFDNRRNSVYVDECGLVPSSAGAGALACSASL